MAAISILDVQADVAALVARGRAAIDAITPTLEAATRPTTAALLGLRASIAGVMADVRAVRELIDPADVLEAAVIVDGQTALALWTWERATRLALSHLETALQDADATLATALEGRVQRQHLVVRGDTLQALAARYLGDFAAWTKIAALNGITGGTLTPGTTLDIPER